MKRIILGSVRTKDLAVIYPDSEMRCLEVTINSGRKGSNTEYVVFVSKEQIELMLKALTKQ